VKRIGLVLLTIVLLGSVFATFSSPVEASISGGYIQIDHPWYNYDGTGNVYAGTYGYESFHGHRIEVQTCLIYNGVWETCPYAIGDGYTGVYVTAAYYTHGANSAGWSSWSWMEDLTTGATTSGYSSCCYVTFRAP
jgi:hypothetical protein